METNQMKTKKTRADFEAEHALWLDEINGGRSPLEVMAALGLTKAQHDRHLLRAFQNGELREISCNYTTVRAHSLHQEIRAMLGVADSQLVRAEAASGGVLLTPVA